MTTGITGNHPISALRAERGGARQRYLFVLVRLHA
jgi:hypothetical protein